MLTHSLTNCLNQVLANKLIKDSGDDHIDLTLCLVVSSATQCIVALAKGVDWTPLTVKNVADLLLQGAISAPVFNSALIYSLRTIPIASATVFTESLSTILQTFWVWHFGLSDPPNASITAGIVIIITLWMCYFAADFDENNRAPGKQFIYNPAPQEDDMDDDYPPSHTKKQTKGVAV